MKNYVKRNLRHTISKKTVQRCIRSDSRIDTDGRKYFLTQRARFESRYLEPEYFGRKILHEMIGKLQTPESLEEKIKHFVLRFGAIIFFNFIEAVRPFKDDSLSVYDREELVGHWARHGVPLEFMYQLFQGTFDYRKPKDKWKTPISEMKEDRIKEVLGAIQKVFPEIYEDFRRARREAFGKTVVENNGVITDTIDDSSY